MCDVFLSSQKTRLRELLFFMDIFCSASEYHDNAIFLSILFDICGHVTDTVGVIMSPTTFVGAAVCDEREGKLK